MEERKQSTREYIENELSQYRDIRCRIAEIKIDMEALEEEMLDRRDEEIEGEALKGQQFTDMPRGVGISDPTARLATGLSIDVKHSKLKIELRFLERRLRRLDAWLESMPNQEKIVMRMIFVDGMSWGEAAHSYNQRPTDGIPREKRTLMGWKQKAMGHLEKTANVQIGNVLARFRH